MATAAQLEANRRNAQKSTGPRTEDGKNRSKFNALDHGCRARVLVLPNEGPDQHVQWSQSWLSSLQPRNPSEEFLVDRLAGLSWQARRVDRAQSARLASRIHRGEVDAVDGEQMEVIELGQRLYRGGHAPQAPCSSHEHKKPVGGGRARHSVHGNVDTDDLMSLVLRLESTDAGCRWLLEQWAELRVILVRGLAWLAPDQRRAVRLLGRRPTDALYSNEVAQVYLAGHVLRNQEGAPFQELLNELGPQEAAVYANYFELRRYDDLMPEDAASAQRLLLEMIDQATEQLLDKAEVLRQLAEADAPWTADRLLWDDTAEGERLRRYELSCDRAWHRMFELMMRVRRTGVELDVATLASVHRSAPSGNFATIDRPAPSTATVVTAPAEPVKPPEPAIEANSQPENAPIEPNSSVQTPRTDPRSFRKESKSDRSTRGTGPTEAGSRANLRSIKNSTGNSRAGIRL